MFTLEHFRGKGNEQVKNKTSDASKQIFQFLLEFRIQLILQEVANFSYGNHT